MADTEKVRPELGAVNDLRGYDHAFLTPEGVEHFAKLFGLAGKIKCYKAKANPDELKGLTLNNGAKSAMGMDAMILAQSICNHLGIKYDQKFGRGSQLRSCCDALEGHFSKTGPRIIMNARTGKPVTRKDVGLED